MTVKGLYDSKPAKLYLFGQPAEGDLKRPWLAAPGIFGAGASSSLLSLLPLVCDLVMTRVRVFLLFFSLAAAAAAPADAIKDGKTEAKKTK